MQLGAMTNPTMDLIPQLDWIGRHNFDYVELTVEPPKSDHLNFDHHEFLSRLKRYNLDVVVHTSPYLPISNPHAAARDSARSELLRMLELAHQLNSPLFTLHYLGAPKFFSAEKTVETYVAVVTGLVRAAKGTGVEIAIENISGNPYEIMMLQEIFMLVPEVRLVLDMGHTNLGTSVNSASDFLDHPILGRRLSHVHMSDNDGTCDLHLPLGSIRNGIDWPNMIQILKNLSYDGRITLEVFSPDLDYLLISRDIFLAMWNRL